MPFRSFAKAIVGMSLLTCASAFATPFTVDVTGVNSYHQFGWGAAGNTIMNVNVGANALITSVVFNINVTAFTPSVLSDLALALTNSTITEGVLWTPGYEDAFAGTATYTGVLDLFAQGLSFNVGANGILRLEFFENIENSAVNPDGIWNFGTVTVNTDAVAVPEPASLAILGLGLAGIRAARRRKSA